MSLGNRGLRPAKIEVHIVYIIARLIMAYSREIQSKIEIW
jgi:hypothetical protein